MVISSHWSWTMFPYDKFRFVIFCCCRNENRFWKFYQYIGKCKQISFAFYRLILVNLLNLTKIHTKGSLKIIDANWGEFWNDSWWREILRNFGQFWGLIVMTWTCKVVCTALLFAITTRNNPPPNMINKNKLQHKNRNWPHEIIIYHYNCSLSCSNTARMNCRNCPSYFYWIYGKMKYN